MNTLKNKKALLFGGSILLIVLLASLWLWKTTQNTKQETSPESTVSIETTPEKLPPYTLNEEETELANNALAASLSQNTVQSNGTINLSLIGTSSNEKVGQITGDFFYTSSQKDQAKSLSVTNGSLELFSAGFSLKENFSFTILSLQKDLYVKIDKAPSLLSLDQDLFGSWFLLDDLRNQNININDPFYKESFASFHKSNPFLEIYIPNYSSDKKSFASLHADNLLAFFISQFKNQNKGTAAQETTDLVRNLFTYAQGSITDNASSVSIEENRIKNAHILLSGSFNNNSVNPSLANLITYTENISYILDWKINYTYPQNDATIWEAPENYEDLTEYLYKTDPNLLTP